MTHVATSETRAQVKALAGVGLIQKHIAGFVGVTQKTLRKHYAAELKEGRSSIVYQAAQVIAKKINEEDAGAAKFLLRTIGGWRETGEDEITDLDADSDNSQVNNEYNPKMHIMDFDKETRVKILRARKLKRIEYEKQQARDEN